MTALREKLTPMRCLQLGSFAVALAVLLVMNRDVFWWLSHAVFSEPREDMSHGWFVPVFTIALLWMKRRELALSAGDPSWRGLILALPGLAVFAIGMLGDQLRLSHVASIWLLWTLLYATWGRRLAHVALFAVSFLLFTVPFGFLDIFTVKLRIVIAALADILLNGIGLEAVRSGTGLYCTAGAGFNIDVADPCSGMRSIFALASLTAGYAYLTQKTLAGKWILFLCAVPLAMLGNLVRILSIAIVSASFGSRFALGFYHDYSGYVVFLVAVLAMIGAGEAVSRLCGRAASPAPQEGADAAIAESPRQSPRLRVLHCVVLVLFPAALAATMLHVRNAPPPVQEDDSFVASSFPELQGFTARRPYFCQNENCLHSVEAELGGDAPEKCPRCGGAMDATSLAEKTLLPGDTRIMKCNYCDALGYQWSVSVVVNGRSRQSIHRPEICLPAQGWSIDRGSIVDFELEGGRSIPMHCMNVRRRSSSSEARMGHAYFFVSARTIAASHMRRILISVKDRAFARRVTRWAMVTISADEPFDSTSARRAATAGFLEALLPALFDDNARLAPREGGAE